MSAALLTPDELAGIAVLHKSAHAKGMPFDSYADATATIGALLAHLAARDEQVRQTLARLAKDFRPEGAPGIQLALCGIFELALRDAARDLGLPL